MAKIRFVREYISCGQKWFDVVYESRQLRIIPVEDLPKTVKAFIEDAKSTIQYDGVMKRSEIIYEH